MSAKRSKIATWLLLVPVTCAAVLVFLELPAFFRFVDYRKVINANPLRANYIDAPEVVYMHRPNSHMKGSQKGGYDSMVYDIPLFEQNVYSFDAQYDKNGFRNAPNLKSADTVVIGDSFVEGTEGATLTEAQLMTSLLTNMSGQVVANLGHNTYGPQQELAVLRHYGLALHPRTVIWVFSESSDIGDAAQYGALVQRESNHWLAFKERSFAKNALNYVRFLKAKRLPAERGRALVRTANGTFTTYFTTADAVSAERLPQHSIGLEETARTLQAAANSCQAQGCRIVFVFAPDKFRVLREFCTFATDSDWRNGTPNDLPARLAGITESMSPKIGYLDLTRALMNTVRIGAMPYTTDDYHWNAVGQKTAATAINDYLTAHANGN